MCVCVRACERVSVDGRACEDISNHQRNVGEFLENESVWENDTDYPVLKEGIKHLNSLKSHLPIPDHN